MEAVEGYYLYFSLFFRNCSRLAFVRSLLSLFIPESLIRWWNASPLAGISVARPQESPEKSQNWGEKVPTSSNTVGHPF